MSDKKFDRILQHKLKGHQISFDESRWEDMEKALNDAEHAHLIDHEVRNRIKDHTYPYKESHWQILKRKLELEKELKEKIYISKIAEAAILLLLLLSAVNVKENLIKNNTTSPEKFVAVAVDKVDNSSSENLSKVDIAADQHNSPSSSALPLDDNSEKINQDLVKQHTSSLTNLVGQASKIIVPVQQSAATQQNINITQVNLTQEKELGTTTTHETFGEIDPGQTETDPQNLTIPEFQSDLLKEDNQAETIENVLQHTTAQGAQKATASNERTIPARSLVETNSLIASTTFSQLTHKGTSLPILNTKLSSMTLGRQIDIASLSINNSALFASMTMAQAPKKKERYIGAMAGVDMNYVRSRVNINNISGPRNFLVLSMTTGANYSVKKGKNEFFTGIGYSEKFYDPNIVETVKVPSSTNTTESASYYSRDYTLEQYDIVHLPAQYRRHLGEAHKLHAYAFAGASVNFVIYTDYEQHDNLNRGQPRPKRLLDQQAAYKSTDFSNGLLEGGYYKDNIYFTADIGLGLEKQIRRTKFFFESQYKRNLFASQLGPQKVKLNSLSFNIGTKYKI